MFPKWTYRCGDLNLKDEGKEVILNGWVNRRRDLGGLIFIDLRDSSGIVQIVFNPEVALSAYKEAENLRNEFVIAVTGKVVARPPEAINPSVPTGEIEVEAHSLTIINQSLNPPFPIFQETEIDSLTRLRYRYLDLRRPRMHRNIIFRHRVVKAVRDFLDEQGFIEIETPILVSTTPEGARDYLVPSRVYPGKFYALPQSPQLFKQILMIAGFDRYFQIARCFRDEDLRADRQPEFTQIDIEMSFVGRDDVLKLTEELFDYVFKRTMGISLPLPLPRITYQEAMELYGTDKPDLRIPMVIKNLDEIFASTQIKFIKEIISAGGTIRALTVPKGEKLSRREISIIEEKAKTLGAKGLFTLKLSKDGLLISSITKYLLPEEKEKISRLLNKEELFLAIGGEKKEVLEILGKLRIELAEKWGLYSEDKFSWAWIVDFPLFSFNKEEGRLEAEHHPFTSPLPEDIPLLEKEPLKVRAASYDLVLNGTEVGSGSIRIHNAELQKKIFSIIGITPDDAKQRFGFLLEALQYGAPPHGGIAPGLDRLVMIMLGEESIREVIPFPKTQNAQCLLTGAPREASPEQLAELKLKVEQ